MADYISRDAVLELVEPDARPFLAERIRNIPSADVAPVKHGEWKWSHDGECSVCGYRNSNFEYNYCPNCGADMMEEK